MSSINPANGLLGYRSPVLFGNAPAGAQYLSQIGTNNLIGYNGQPLSPDAARFAGGLLIHGLGSPIAAPAPQPLPPPEPFPMPDGGGGAFAGSAGSPDPNGGGSSSAGSSPGSSATPGDNLHTDGLAVDTTGGKSIGERIGDRIEGKLGIGPGNHMANTLGTVGGLVGFAPGIAGSILGTAIDAYNENKDRDLVGIPGVGFGGVLSAGLNSITGGLLGTSFADNLAGTNLSESRATAGLNTNDPNAANSANASGGKNGVGESAAGIGSDDNSGGKNGVGETMDSGVSTATQGNRDAAPAEGTDTSTHESSSYGNEHDNREGTDTEGGGEGDKAGGLIVGPGTGTSDSIPKHLSNGEFVVDAKTVRHYGPAFFLALQKRAGAKGPALKLGNRGIAR